MQVSAEIRWFWRERPPAGLEDWFRDAGVHGCAPSGEELRADVYLRDPGQVELGVKRRGGKAGVEVKARVSVLEEDLAAGPFKGPVEIWTKVSTPALDVHPFVATAKQRWLRKFDTGGASPVEIPLGPNAKPLDPDRPLPRDGCNVELTRLSVDDSVWWTLGLEAFGGLGRVEDSLRATATLLAARRPPPLEGGQCASYPAWLGDRTPAPS